MVKMSLQKLYRGFQFPTASLALPCVLSHGLNGTDSVSH